MDVREFSMLMAQRGCVGNEKNYCGSFNNYPFTARFLNGKTGGKTTALLQVQFNKKVPSKMTKEIRKEHRGQVSVYKVNRSTTTGYLVGGVVGAAIASANSNAGENAGDTALLSLSITARSTEEFANLLDSVLNQIVQIAPGYGLFIPDACPVCAQPGCDSYAYTKGSYRAVHAHCVQANAQAKQAKVDKNLREGSYALGIVGAILGAIVGALPSIVLAAMANYILAVLFALVPLGAYYGYKWFKGKMSKGVLGIIILISILMVPVMQYGEFLMDEIVNYGAFYSPLSYFYDISFALSHNASLVVVSWGQMLFFMAIGLLIVGGIISRTGQKDVLDTSFSAATLRPINAAAQPTAPQAMPTAPPVAQAPVAEQTAPPQANI
ncbi:hypothetical protein LJC61_07725 [Ruminococcaceae bacterium OttesenSCG-928-A16]|nr:hypothetical protein [Ruminococcaceae bacterium OttesenSCG-928-A16]